MSYGIWRKRGTGWCSIEVDSPWNGTSVSDLSYDNPVAHGFLTRSLDKHGIAFDDMDDDVTILRWLVNQRSNQPQRKIIGRYFGGGEHCTWIAFDDIDALNDALFRHGITGEDKEAAHMLAMVESYA